MRKINQTVILLTAVAILAYACGDSQAADDKMAQLKKLKEQQKELEGQIKELEKELKASGELTNEVNEVFVTALNMQPTTFIHEIEVRGGVESRKDVVLSAETMGRIQSISVKEGQSVTKGQLLISLDADIIRNNIGEVETQLELATTIYERQEKLWKQNIGTEVQYLQAKNNKESLESRLATLKAQLRQSNVYAPFAGVIDNVPARIGEMAQPGMPLIRIVNQADMFITSDVSETHLGKFKEGQMAEVYFPTQDKTVQTTITNVGRVIKNDNRTFEIELSMPKVDFEVKPNQVVVVRLIDYKNDQALVVPTKIIQTDSQGSYLYEVVSADGMKKAKKVYVTPGVSFGLETEIKEGLTKGQVIANDGYRDLSPDVAVSIK
ncbi:efflux RND transporter periplasmic adaptor subunit [Marinoscillum sp.]|uniref:efflux RND transporter periplasmic adaptor subunit n=1 Tax=Marinoscillum sp. TaxID=2024838 RepID=UPI003BAAE546